MISVFQIFGIYFYHYTSYREDKEHIYTLENNLSYKLIPINNLSQIVFYTVHHTDFLTSQKSLDTAITLWRNSNQNHMHVGAPDSTAETKAIADDLHSINRNVQEMRDGNQILSCVGFYQL